MNELLSKDSRARRSKRQVINLQMAVIAWSLEFISGLLLLIYWFLSEDKNHQLALIMTDILLRFIVIPGSYLLNTEVNKALIVAEGWWKSLRTTFRSNKIQPSNNQNQQNNLELILITRRLRPIPNPISSITGNIIALNNLKEEITLRSDLNTLLEEVKQKHAVDDNFQTSVKASN